jgi:hypothetical protein
MLSLRHLVKNLSVLCQALRGCQSELLRIIGEVGILG